MPLPTELSIQDLGQQVITTALSKLEAHHKEDNIACLTNAGYVDFNGESTFAFLDIAAEKAHISLGRGNLMQVHTAATEPLWFAFICKKGPKELMLTYLDPSSEEIQASEPMNVYVDVNQSFDPFSQVLGNKAFALVSFANGWADRIPQDIMQGALWHDHLCSGMFSGFFTVNYIRRYLPLQDQSRYIYIGVPARCQDDYLMRVLNLAPGKLGYLTMAYPGTRPWTTAENSYSQLGGIIIRFNHSTQTGDANLLRVDWYEDDFKAFIGMPEMDLNFKKHPWQHICYNRFFSRHMNEPEKFVSLIKNKSIENQHDLNRLVDMGANPLEEMLGADINWIPERD